METNSDTFIEDENDTDSDTETTLLPISRIGDDDVVHGQLDASSYSVTYYVGSNMGDEEEETQDMAYVASTGSNFGALIYMSFSSTVDGKSTDFLGSTFDDDVVQDMDVVDGQEELAPMSQQNTLNENGVPTASNIDIFTPFSNNVVLPVGPTNSEHISRIATWVMATSQTDEDDECGGVDEPSNEKGAIDYFAKLINLCADKLAQCPLFLPTVRSVSEFEERSETVFQMIVRLLESNTITEALMQIINLIWTTGNSFTHSTEGDEDREPSGEACKSRELMLMVLNCASAQRTRLNAVSMEKLLSHNIFTDGEYFRNVSICTSIKTPSKEFTVFQRVETWINNALKVALECQTAVVDLDIRVILEVIREVNLERSLFLSPEEESKYAGKAQRVVREILFGRCHAYLRSQGFVFEGLPRPQPEMAAHHNDRAVPSISPPRPQTQRYVDAWLQNEIAEVYAALVRDDASMSRENSLPQSRYHSNGDQALPISGSSRGGSSGGLGLNETAIDFEGFEMGRLSQDSLHSRMNQGYTSSQSLSQGSLPRANLSQSSTNSSMNRLLSFGNQYIFFPSSSESSSGPTGPKRPRLYTSSQ